ncbi:hypothetical protein BJF79_47945 [Actinomadura sp. CNU-125]|uniref:GntR family transcriptional regulator n=1 Tax=Actinomadura sp. CNU-125 TaxID=1904961 RepID=UPI00095BAAFB|nr:GntR family transcriptional regulator [Actinomadura sp. CNU-125]OLT19285.1 hypothetical protein BJF79_47945 [Actinomadura sp. CNU-125]
MNRSKQDAHHGSITAAGTAADGAGATGADFLQLDARDAPRGRRAEWLAGRLRDAIADGRLPVGARLPATRTLAADLRLSRGVVTEGTGGSSTTATSPDAAGARTVVVTAPLTAPPAATPTAPHSTGTAGERARTTGPFRGDPDRTVSMPCATRAPASTCHPACPT